MEVDHVIELQVTPDSMRSEFNSVDNYELLDRTSRGEDLPMEIGPLSTMKLAAWFPILVIML